MTRLISGHSSQPNPRMRNQELKRCNLYFVGIVRSWDKLDTLDPQKSNFPELGSLETRPENDFW